MSHRPIAAILQIATVAAITVLATGSSVGAELSILDYDSGGRLRKLHDVPPETPRASGQIQSGQASDTASPENFDPDKWFEPDQVLIGNPPANFEDTVRFEGFHVLQKVPLKALAMDVWRVHTPDKISVRDAIAQLRQEFRGLLVDADHLYEQSAGPAAAAMASQTRAIIGWSDLDPSCGTGIKIGMVDTPVDVTHRALAGQKIVYRSFILPSRTPAPADHGTSIAAMLVGKPGKDGFGGLLPGAELLAGNIFTFNDQGAEMADVVALLRALDWLTAEKVQVVNLSMAGADNQLMHHVVEQAGARGMVLVAAVGNWGTTDRPAYPAAYAQAIGVTAVDANDFIYSYANRGSYVAFAAPGVQIWTAVPGGGRFQSGTSFAVPYLTSVIATEMAAGRAPSAERIRELLSHEAVDLGPPGKDDTFGWGLIGTPPLCNQGGAPQNPDAADAAH